MVLKGGIKAGGVQPELILALCIANYVYRRNNCTLTITSLLDGTHQANSLHYKGYAADLRIRDISAPLTDVIVRELREALGEEYDVVLENDHIHLEWDVK